jgi:hypothetical protein
MRALRRFRPGFECMSARIAPSTIAVVAPHVDVKMPAAHHDIRVEASQHRADSHHGGASPCDSTGDPSDTDGNGSDPVILAPPPGTTSTTSTVC